jgi:carbamoyl-phosphate synthase small subunit
MNESIPAILLLEDGTYFKGISVGKQGTTFGEIAFNTSMTGYQEIFTDPSYYGQIAIMTTSHIGNYGSHPDENESDGIMISGLVTKKFSKTYSRTSADESINDKLIKSGCVGISDIDTRALVRHIRNAGAMNCVISSETDDVDVLKAKLKDIPSMEGMELSSKVTTNEVYTVKAENSTLKVALIDFGVKKNIIRCLNERGCDVTVFPMHTTISEITAINPDGIMLSNGPGDPAAMIEPTKLVKQITELEIPVFGICMGHQLLGHAMGLNTVKMFNGHRGSNHPVKNLITGKCEVTSQNHGFVISDESISKNDAVEVTHRHLNDNTIAGIRVKNKSIFSVQYHPEASAGPHDSRYLFDQFIDNMKAK